MTSLLFNYKFTARMHDIDAAGVMFFARYFYYIHDAYEEFLNQQTSIEQLLANNILLPLRHAEADFKAPVLLNESINIEIYPGEIEQQAFTLHYRLVNASAKIKATAVTQHVCLDALSRQRSTLPAAIHTLLTGVIWLPHHN